MTPQIFLWVFLGGALGSVAREMLAPLSPLPWPWAATLLINVVATFLIGCVYAAQSKVHNHIRIFAAVGFCGGFSTFSTFTQQTVDLLETGLLSQATIYVAGSIVLGLGAAVAGEALANAGFRAAERSRP
ncbi:MAG: CrcB family protein [Pseudomonadota bacterium]